MGKERLRNRKWLFFRSHSRSHTSPLVAKAIASESEGSDGYARAPGTSTRSKDDEKFVYLPLDLKQRSLRLIRVRRDRTFDGHIECDIRHASISETYVCLSYVWGPKTPTQSIMIAGRPFEVRQNLWNFLHASSKQQVLTSVWFWIDAVCIDQANVSERNHQVQQMGQIYGNAKGVISWLGSSPRIARILARECEEGSVSQKEARAAFQGSPYWRRAWITQEVALARNLAVMAGDTALDMDSAINLLHKFRLPYYETMISSDKGPREFRDPTKWVEYKGRSLVFLLDKFTLKECELFHDVIYSLLALCGDGSGLKVNYAHSRHDIVMHVVYNCKRSCCLCSFIAIADALNLDQFGRLDHVWNQARFDSLPFLECTVSISEPPNDSGQADLLYVRPKDVCTSMKWSFQRWYSLHGSKLSVGQAEHPFGLSIVQMHTQDVLLRGRAGIREPPSLELSDKGDSRIVWFSLLSLMDLTLICNSVRRSIRFCPRVESVDTPAEGLHGALPWRICPEFVEYMETRQLQ
jgi:hypothetical protein